MRCRVKPHRGTGLGHRSCGTLVDTGSASYLEPGFQIRPSRGRVIGSRPYIYEDLVAAERIDLRNDLQAHRSSEPFAAMSWHYSERLNLRTPRRRVPPGNAAGRQHPIGCLNDQIPALVIEPGPADLVVVGGRESTSRLRRYGRPGADCPRQGRRPPGCPMHLDARIQLTVTHAPDLIALRQRSTNRSGGAEHSGNRLGVRPSYEASFANGRADGLVTIKHRNRQLLRPGRLHGPPDECPGRLSAGRIGVQDQLAAAETCPPGDAPAIVCEDCLTRQLLDSCLPADTTGVRTPRPQPDSKLLHLRRIRRAFPRPYSHHVTPGPKMPPGRHASATMDEPTPRSKFFAGFGSRPGARMEADHQD